MAYLDNPLIPTKQQAPSGMFHVGLDPLSVASIYTYFNAQVDASLFTDVGATTQVVNEGDDVRAWKELTGTQPNATNNGGDQPHFTTSNGVKSVTFDVDVLTCLSTTDQFNFMHNGDGGEIIVVSALDTGGLIGSFFVSNTIFTNDVGFGIGLFVDVPGVSLNYIVQTGNAANFASWWADDTNFTNVDTPTAFQGSYKESEVPESTLEINNVDVQDTDKGNDSAPVVTDADEDLTLGLDLELARLYSVAIFDDILDAETRGRVTNFLLATATSTELDAERIEVFSSETGYADFPITTIELFYAHSELAYCQTHSVFVKSDSSDEVTVTFYAGDTVTKVETLTDEGIDFNVPGTTRLGFKTLSGTAIGRNWSR